MGRIRQLDDYLATLIAAGEVVQGPYSVVKELMDNAIDASATEVEISIEDGGMKNIRVADNGEGMDKEDAVLCLSRHATSKIKSMDDLNHILTNGFRGEALAAISSVSRIQIDTRSDDPLGTRVISVAGEVHQVKDISRRRGTTIDVSNLFFNTPARREYCNTERAEANKVSKAVINMALAYPHVKFSLRVDGKETFSYFPTRDTLDRIVQIYGENFANQLVPIHAHRSGVTVQGFVTIPDSAVKRTQKSHFMVNSRPFQSTVVKRVIANAFKGVIPQGSYAEAIINIELSPSEVDINVSPDKSQINFKKSGLVWGTITDALGYGLSFNRSIHVIGERETSIPAGSPETTSSQTTVGLEVDEIQDTGGSTSHELRLSLWEGGNKRHGLPENPPLLMQVANTFIFAPSHDGVYIVDQHSAHERILFEELKKRYEQDERSIPKQALIFPLILPVTPQEVLLYEEMEPFFEKMGFEVIQGGSREIWIQAVPASIRDSSPTEILKKLVEVYHDLSDMSVNVHDSTERITPLEERGLKTIACRAAIKSGKYLSQDELRNLWNKLLEVDLAAHDIHGRPAILFLTAEELSRRMSRGGFSAT